MSLRWVMCTGDYDTAAKLLAAAKIIAAVPANPTSVTWTAGASILVCTGDLIDKYTQNFGAARLRDGARGAAAAVGRQAKSSSRWAITRPVFWPTRRSSIPKRPHLSPSCQAAGIAPEDVGAAKMHTVSSCAPCPLRRGCATGSFHTPATRRDGYGQAHPRSSRWRRCLRL